VAVAVDVKGDVYVYHESGFLDRPGADRYIIGNITNSSVENVVQEFINSKKTIRPLPPDVGYLDAFDHVVSRLINQARDDEKFGISWNQGPVKCR
jgi:dTDP-4-amino-4,6-dideoxy-D-glucose ammonia-lyase